MAENKKEILVDDELFDIVADVQSGNDESFSLLKAKYSPLVSSLVRSFDSGAADISEYEKEAESALLKAAVRFDLQQSEVAFGLFAKICIRNALISLRRKEMSRKRRLERNVEPVRKKSGMAVVVSRDSAETKELVERIKAVLSPYEKLIFNEYMSDKTIEEIAETVGRSKKSVNNAIYRIKEKVKSLEIAEK